MPSVPYCHLLGVIAGLTVSLPAQFFAERNHSAFNEPLRGVLRAIIDVDGDGASDLLSSDAQLHYYRNDGHGHFAYTASSPLSLIASASLHSVGDYDGDGDIDFLAGPRGYANQGDGTFVQDPNISIFALGLVQSELFDYDQDGDLDILVDAFGLKLLENDGTGLFTDITATLPAGLNLSGGTFRTIDLDGDGDIDVARGNGGFGSVTLQVWRNQGGGVFAAENPPAPTGTAAASSLHVADFNGDGRQDLACIVNHPTPGAFLVTEQAGTWTLQAMPSLTITPFDYADVTAADWDGDGHADWVLRAGIQLQTGPLQFTFSEHIGGLLVGDISVTDIDGDNAPDAVALGSIGFARNTADGGAFSERASLTGGMPVQRVNAVRNQGGATPKVELLASSWFHLYHGRNDPSGSIGLQSTLHMQEILVPLVLDAALVSTPSLAGGHEIVVCTASGVLNFAPQGTGFVSATAPILAVMPSCVDTGNIDSVTGDELLFGGSGFDGPRMFTKVAGAFVNISPTLPPATPNPASGFEYMVVADMDGDGDNDVVHEHRVLRNDAGTWSVAADFAALTHSGNDTAVPIDIDGDGDLDLFLPALAGGSLLLEHTTIGFVDVTATNLPGGQLVNALEATRGDVDGDGDHDLLIRASQSSHLLLNDDGIFTLFTGIGPPGALVDANHDGKADLFAGDRLLFNLHTFLRAPQMARLNSVWTIELETWRTNAMAQLAWLAIGFREQYQVCPSIGVLFVDPLFADVVVTPMTAGQASHSVTIPANASILGVQLSAQGLAVDGVRLQLSNLVRDLVR